MTEKEVLREAVKKLARLLHEQYMGMRVKKPGCPCEACTIENQTLADTEDTGEVKCPECDSDKTTWHGNQKWSCRACGHRWIRKNNSPPKEPEEKGGGLKRLKKALNAKEIKCPKCGYVPWWTPKEIEMGRLRAIELRECLPPEEQDDEAKI